MEENKIPENFRSVINEFTKNLSITFPEYAFLWSKWTDLNTFDEVETKNLYEYCLTVFPERFFDILYQNNDIFQPENETNTLFLPNIDFKLLYNCAGVSDNTKQTMWKYLQLVLFTVIGGVKDKNTFGDTMNMFDGIDEKELNEKLNEAMGGISEFFNNIGNENAEQEGVSQDDTNGDKFEMPDMKKMFENMPNAEEFKNTFEKMGGLPDMENMQDHLKTLFNGKIGTLAKDMAEEISGEFQDLLGEDCDNLNNTSDIIKKLMKNPKKIMDLMKKVSTKLDNKMQSGEISRDEIIKEAGELFGKMKDMGGADQFKELFKNLTKSMGGMAGMAGMGKNTKLDTNALSRMTKQQSTRERMLKKLEQRKQEQALQNQMRSQNTPPVNYSLEQTENPNNLVFRLPEQGNQEKTYIHPDILAEIMNEDEKQGQTSQTNKKKKKKTKK